MKPIQLILTDSRPQNEQIQFSLLVGPLLFLHRNIMCSALITCPVANTKTPVVDYFETRFTIELYLECRHKVKDRKYWKLAIVLHVRCVNVKKNLCFHNNDRLFG